MRTEREIRAVLFDLDNTLVRFIDAQRAACAAVIDLAGTGSVEDLFEFFLRPKHNFESHAHILDYLSTIASSCDPAMACARYEEVKLAALEPYEGARSTLERLSTSLISLRTFFHSFALPALFGYPGFLRA